jgi:cellulose synthase/poly-beta-1,6-N-acetylglucosamine synthase-like glycosyltransferase
MEVLFWILIGLVLYPYVGYPVLLYFWNITFPREASGSGNPTMESPEPRVSMIIAAYNEEKSIEKKILNSIGLNYPRHKIEHVFLSDGSTDKTAPIIRKYEGSGVILHEFGDRMGKTHCLNFAIPRAQGDIIVFSDANSQFDRDAVMNLVKGFASEREGFVTGWTRYVSVDAENTSGTIGLYSRMEKQIKKWESDFNSCMTADGAIFAIRKNLYMPLKDSDINDVVIPFKILIQGYRGVFQKEAYCTESTAGSKKGEFKRQVRITNRTLRAIFSHRRLLNPLAHPLISFQIASHLLIRLMAPFFLVLLFLVNALLVIKNPTSAYSALLLFQILFAGLSFLGSGKIGNPAFAKYAHFAYIFLVMNIAFFWGWGTFVRGEKFVTWETIRQ